SLDLTPENSGSAIATSLLRNAVVAASPSCPAKRLDIPMYANNHAFLVIAPLRGDYATLETSAPACHSLRQTTASRSEIDTFVLQNACRDHDLSDRRASPSLSGYAHCDRFYG